MIKQMCSFPKVYASVAMIHCAGSLVQEHISSEETRERTMLELAGEASLPENAKAKAKLKSS